MVERTLRGDAILSVRNLTTAFETRFGSMVAVNEVSFDVAAGTTVGVVGESGSGKSVTFLSLLGLVPPGGKVLGGSALFEGSDLLAMRGRDLRLVRGRRIGMVFQDPLTSLNPSFTVGRQMIELLRVHGGLGRTDARKRALQLLGLVGIPEAQQRVSSYPHELSGGMRQRVMIAMALSLHPTVIIADEPTTALDATMQAQILDLLESLRRQFGMTLVLITHDLGLVARYCEGVLVMYAGSLVEAGPAADVFARPAHPYTAALLESTPRWDRPRSERVKAIRGQPPRLGQVAEGCPFHPRCFLTLGRDECRQSRPSLDSVGDGRHRSACHFSDELLSK